MKAIWKDNSSYSKLLLTVGITLLSAVLFTFLSLTAVMVITGIPYSQIQGIITNYSDHRAGGILKIVQTISAFGTFVVPPFFLAYFFSTKPVSYLGLDQKPGRSWTLAVFIMLVALPFINFLGDLNSHLMLPEFLKGVERWMKSTEDQAAKITELFLDMKGPRSLMINLLMIGLIPALGEELVFRGVLQRIFTDWSKNKHVAIWTTAILFSAMHMQFFGFLPRMVLGAMLGYMYAWSGSLWLPIIAHFTNNAVAVLAMYYFKHGMITMDPDKIGTGNDYVAIIFSFVLTSFALILIYRRTQFEKSICIPEQVD